jgi:hypothetical protein
MRIASVARVIIGALVFSIAARLPAEAQTMQAAKVKASIASCKSEQAVTIEMRDGTKVKGYIRDRLDESFTLIDTKTLQATTIAYSDVAQVHKGRPTVVRLLGWAGAVYGTVAAIALVTAALGGFEA